jgi:Na+/melibiose symporter-like transporter
MLKYVPGDKYTNGLLISIAVTIAPLITRMTQNWWTSKQIYFVFSSLSIVFSLLHIIAFDKESTAALIMIILIAICVDAIGFTNYYVEYEFFNPKVG